MTDVWISITGTQSADGESDTVELTTAGRLEQEEDGLLLTCLLYTSPSPRD